MPTMRAPRRAVQQYLQSLGLFIQPLPNTFFRVMRWKLNDHEGADYEAPVPHPWRADRETYTDKFQEEYDIDQENFDEVLDNPEEGFRKPTARMLADWDKPEWVEMHMELMSICTENIEPLNLFQYIADDPDIQGHALIRPSTKPGKSFEVLGVSLWAGMSTDELTDRGLQAAGELDTSLRAGKTAELVVACTRGKLDVEEADTLLAAGSKGSSLARAKRLSASLRSMTPAGAGTALFMHTVVDIWGRKSRRSRKYDRVVLDVAHDLDASGMSKKRFNDSMKNLRSVRLYGRLGFRAVEVTRMNSDENRVYYMQLPLPDHTEPNFSKMFQGVRKKYGLDRFGEFCDQNPKCM